jgi:hypothetical protein
MNIHALHARAKVYSERFSAFSADHAASLDVTLLLAGA